jgi:hypothetical protein
MQRGMNPGPITFPWLLFYFSPVIVGWVRRGSPAASGAFATSFDPAGNLLSLYPEPRRTR